MSTLYTGVRGTTAGVRAGIGGNCSSGVLRFVDGVYALLIANLFLRYFEDGDDVAENFGMKLVWFYVSLDVALG